MPPSGGEETVRFYQDLLGIPQVAKPPQLARAGAWFESGPLRVHLGVERSFSPARKAHQGLPVTELKDLVARLTAADVEVVWDPQWTPQMISPEGRKILGIEDEEEG